MDKKLTSNKLNELRKIGIDIIDSTILLKDRYSCPENWLQCPLSGECISTQRQCDGYVDCNDGSSIDEDPKTVISNCCDEFTLSIETDESISLIYSDIYRYMGVYEMIACSRLIMYWYFTQLTVTLLNCSNVLEEFESLFSGFCTIFCK